MKIVRGYGEGCALSTHSTHKMQHDFTIDFAANLLLKRERGELYNKFQRI
jgi:hypothetical protein